MKQRKARGWAHIVLMCLLLAAFVVLSVGSGCAEEYAELTVTREAEAVPSALSADELAEEGAVSSTKEEIGRECDVILTMLPNSPQVRSVMLGPDGVAQYMHAGQVYIDMSSINPVSSREIASPSITQQSGYSRMASLTVLLPQAMLPVSPMMRKTDSSFF